MKNGHSYQSETVNYLTAHIQNNFNRMVKWKQIKFPDKTEGSILTESAN